MTEVIDPKILELSVLNRYAMASMLELAAKRPPGCFVEFGVYKGGSAWHLARLAAEQGRELHLFDTFKGIPEASDGIDMQHKIGDFANTDIDLVRELIPSAIFHVGIFPNTWPRGGIGPIAFVHVDCDQYVSCYAAIEYFAPHLSLGGVMLFDDYNETKGVTRAVDEFYGDRISHTPEGKAFIVQTKQMIESKFNG